MTEPVRWFSEAEEIFPVPDQQCYARDENGEPILLARDDRMKISIEWATEKGIPIPDNWREQKEGEQTVTDLELVLEATERILKGYPEDWTEEERDEQESEDAALCAAFIQELQAKRAA